MTTSFTCQQHVILSAPRADDLLEDGTIAGRNTELTNFLEQAGIDSRTSTAALEIDDVLQQWRRRVNKRELGSAALAAFAPGYFNSMLLALDHHFMHRMRGAEGKEGNPLNEVRMLSDSIMEHGGVLQENRTIKYKAEKAVAAGEEPPETYAAAAEALAAKKHVAE